MSTPLEPVQNEFLRPLVSSIGGQISRLSSGLNADETRATASKLSTEWDALVKTLALGDAPQGRSCPNCGNVGMRLATRCGFCWIVLTPPAA
jgi:hypothetical protein